MKKSGDIHYIGLKDTLTACSMLPTDSTRLSGKVRKVTCIVCINRLIKDGKAILIEANKHS